MSVIFPFRNIKNAPEHVKCILCPAVVPSVEAYSVMNDGCVEGYVCADCFLMLNDPPLAKAN